MFRRKRRRHPPRYWYDDDAPDWYPGRRKRGGCFKTFLFTSGLIIVVAIVIAVLLALRAAILAFIALVQRQPLIKWGLVTLAVFLILAGVLWLVASLYGHWQKQLEKRDSRDHIRLTRDERIVVRHRKTGQLTPLQEETPQIPQRASRMPPASLYSDQTQPQLVLPAWNSAPANAPWSPTTPQRQEIVYYASVRGSIRPGQLVLGMRLDGTLRVGTWEDIKTVLVLGAMASGKTSTLALLTLQAIQGGALIAPCDPHATKPDSLYRRVAPLSGFLWPGAVMATTHDDILGNASIVGSELERRVQGGAWTRPLLLVLDEVNRLVDDEEISQELITICQRIGREGRDYGVYCAAGFHELAYLAHWRKKFVSFIVHRVVEAREAEHVIPHRFAKLAPELPNGLTFVKDAYGQTEQLQQVYITPRDIAAIAGEYAPPQATPYTPRRTRQITRDFTLNQQAAYAPGPSVPVWNAPYPPKERIVQFLDMPHPPQNPAPQRSTIPDELRQKIIRLARKGMSRRKIKDALGLHGDKYEIVRRVLDEEGL